MASPLKRRKESQESKLTSTPQRVTTARAVPSPSFSSIASRSPSSQEQATQTSASGNLSQLSQSFDYGKDLNYDGYFSNISRINRTGRVWKIYRPLRGEGLYYQILTEPENAGEHVEQFLRTFRLHPEDGVFHLLRLCVDLCGYQNFDLLKYYNYPRVDFKKIFEALADEKCNTELVSLKKYLFAEPDNTRLAEIFKLGAYNFIQKLVIKSDETGIAQYFRYFLKFVIGMIGQDTRSVAHTGTILGLKIITALCIINYEILNGEGVSSNDDQNQNKVKYNLHCVEKLFFRAKDLCLIRYEKCEIMEVALANEMLAWLQYLPQVFIDTYNCLNLLGKLMENEDKKVRKAALTTFQNVLQLKVLGKYRQIPELLFTVEGRFYDVDSAVTLKALEVYQTALQIYDISAESFQLLLKLTYDQNYLYAKSAASCIVVVMQQNNITDKYVLLKLVKMSTTTPPSLTPLLVEAFVECMPELKYWKCYVKILSKDNENDNDKAILCNIFAESVHQTLLGVSTKQRMFSRKVTEVPPEENEQLIQTFIPVAKDLLSKYHTQPGILTDLLKIIALTLTDVEEYEEEYSTFHREIVELTNRIFAENTDKVLLETAADLLLRFYNNNIATETIIPLLNWYPKKFTESVSSPTIVTEEQLIPKLALLFSRFDLCQYHNIDFKTLTDNWKSFSQEVCANLMMCCRWHLLWRLKKTKGDQQGVYNLLSCRNDFLLELDNCLIDPALQGVAFTQLCEFALEFTNELVKICRVQKSCEILKLKIESSDNIEDGDNILSEMEVTIPQAIENIIKNKKVSKENRKKCLKHFIALVFHNVLPAGCLTSVFRHFNTLYNEFGLTIESAIKTMSDADHSSALALVVVDTLATTFKLFLQDNGAFDQKSAKVRKELRGLVNRFATCKEVKRPKVSGFILYFAVNFALQKIPAYAPFLPFVVVFMENVEENKVLVEIRDRLKKNLPTEHAKDASILYFSKHLNKKINGEVAETSLVPTELFKKPKGRGRKAKRNVRNKENRPNVATNKRALNVEQESSTDNSDVMSIHDSSDDQNLVSLMSDTGI